MDTQRPKPKFLERQTTGRFIRVREESEDGSWRVVIRRSRATFDDRSKEIFLQQYAEHGRIGDAALSAGVTVVAVRNHLQIDEEFAEACLEAEEEYRCKLIGHAQNLIFNGTQRKNYDRNGNLISEETVYPIRLIEMELKKHDKGYTDRKEIDVTHSGGIIIAPKETASIEDWESRFSKNKDEDLIDITPEKVRQE